MEPGSPGTLARHIDRPAKRRAPGGRLSTASSQRHAQQALASFSLVEIDRHRSLQLRPADIPGALPSGQPEPAAHDEVAPDDTGQESSPRNLGERELFTATVADDHAAAT